MTYGLEKLKHSILPELISRGPFIFTIVNYQMQISLLVIFNEYFPRDACSFSRETCSFSVLSWAWNSKFIEGSWNILLSERESGFSCSQGLLVFNATDGRLLWLKFGMSRWKCHGGNDINPAKNGKISDVQCVMFYHVMALSLSFCIAWWPVVTVRTHNVMYDNTTSLCLFSSKSDIKPQVEFSGYALLSEL